MATAVLTASPTSQQLRDALRRHPTAIIGSVVLAAVALIALLAPWLGTVDPQAHAAILGRDAGSAAPYDVSLQAVSKHLKVLEDAGLVTRTREAQRRPVHLEAEVFDLMTKWIERYRRRAEERFARLDAVLARMQDDENPDTIPTKQEGTAS